MKSQLFKSESSNNFQEVQLQTRTATDKLFFGIMMLVTFLVYCFINILTVPVSAWERASNLLNK
jgi:hypothetical protein